MFLYLSTLAAIRRARGGGDERDNKSKRLSSVTGRQSARPSRLWVPRRLMSPRHCC